jgi:hypothetical protein
VSCRSNLTASPKKETERVQKNSPKGAAGKQKGPQLNKQGKNPKAGAAGNASNKSNGSNGNKQKQTSKSNTKMKNKK